MKQIILKEKYFSNNFWYDLIQNTFIKIEWLKNRGSNLCYYYSHVQTIKNITKNL